MSAWTNVPVRFNIERCGECKGDKTNWYEVEGSTQNEYGTEEFICTSCDGLGYLCTCYDIKGRPTIINHCLAKGIASQRKLIA